MGYDTHQTPQFGKLKDPDYDEGGNVWEWTTEGGGSSSVLRGASWNVSNQSFLRVVNRYGGLPSNRDYRNGFRVVLFR